jgi:hypothetical protein
MSYIYGAPIFYVSRSHTTTQHSTSEIVGSNPTGGMDTSNRSVVSVVGCQVEVSATS